MVSFTLNLGDVILSASYRNSSDATLSPEEWVDAYGDMLYRYALMRLRKSSEAEEVVQETFLAGIRYVDQFEGKGSQSAWLLGILKRKVIDTLRTRQRQNRNRTQEDVDISDLMLFDESGHWRAGIIPTVEPENFVETEEMWQIVRECLSTIPQAQADAFVLSVMEEMEPDRICEELGITTDNLWVRLHRARLGLARCVSSKWLLESRG